MKTAKKTFLKAIVKAQFGRGIFFCGSALSGISALPSNQKPGPLAPRPVPSQAEMAKFNRIEAVVKEPTLLLDHAKRACDG